MKTKLLSALLLLLGTLCQAQIITKEDSLNAGLTSPRSNTVISGYGEALYRRDLRLQTATANLPRIITFIGHKFNKNITFFSETELENTKVDGTPSGGEISLEQAFLKLSVSREYYFTAGLFIPRIGLINENHLPNTFNGNQRPMVETLLIPATWREIGVGFYAAPNRIPGLNLNIAVVNGLDAGGFSSSRGIGGGRAEGRFATARNIAITGAALYYYNNWRFQASAYYGGSVGYSNHIADSLKLQTGAFGTPVTLVEANAVYHNNGFTFKALATAIFIKDASSINRAFANNTPSAMNGGYVEVAYDILHGLSKGTSERQLTLFGRYERIKMAASVPENGILDEQYNQQYVFAGLAYYPIRSVALKADVQIVSTGTPNTSLILNPYPAAQPYYAKRSYLNVGLAYSF